MSQTPVSWVNVLRLTHYHLFEKGSGFFASKRKLTWPCNDGSTLLMQVTLKIEHGARHGPPYALHMAHKNTRLHMGARIC